MRTDGLLRGALTCCLFLVVGTASAAGPSAKNQLGPLQAPSEPAAAVMAPGDSQVKGRVCAKYGGLLGRKYYPNEPAPVILLPMTPSMEEWYLRFSEDTVAGISELPLDAFALGHPSTTDEKGRFHFKNLKPGKYVVLSSFSFPIKTSWREQVGTETAYNGYGQALYSNPVYGETQHDYLTGRSQLAKIVNIKKNGQVLALGDIHQ